MNAMVLFNLLTGNSHQTYQRFIRVAKFLLRRLNILNAIEDIDGKETGYRTLGVLYFDNGTLFSSWTEKEPLQVRAASE